MLFYVCIFYFVFFFFFQAEDGIRDHCVTGVQTCALPISGKLSRSVLFPSYIYDEPTLKAFRVSQPPSNHAINKDISFYHRPQLPYRRNSGQMSLPTRARTNYTEWAEIMQVQSHHF